jgi:hypothetical protein
MKISNLLPIIVFSTGIALVSGCGTTINHATPLTKEQILLEPDVKSKEPVVFPKALEEVRQAGLRSLVAVGCEVKTEEPLFLAGFRPHKMGLFVGSGGETVKIFLYPQAVDITHIWVDTDLSFVGMAGQQSWDRQVFESMTNILNQPTSGVIK